MVFSLPIFLFAFLPAVAALYFLAVKCSSGTFWPNIVLILSSFAFYYWGSGNYTVILLLSALFNYFAGQGIIGAASRRTARALLSLGITANLCVLIYYKYSYFFCSSLYALLGRAAPDVAAFPPLPIGISFFTFMAIAYLVDVWRHEHKASSVYDFALYLSLFPHLVAGPIVRYNQIRTEIEDRRTTWAMVSEGLWVFTLGFAKKVLLADTLAAYVDQVFAAPPAQLDAATLWLGALSYSFQIYFDFSGYTDMAIGLALLFGFHFPPNFNMPYRATSITDFWRRWHMSLSTWFKDYLYIPLGGNRRGLGRVCLNLMIVFVLCGLWHGAAWTFVAWGVYHGVWLIIERVARNIDLAFAGNRAVKTLYAFFLVTVGWVLFRSPGIGHALDYLKGMFLPGSAAGVRAVAMDNSILLTFAVAAALSFFRFKAHEAQPGREGLSRLLRPVCVAVLLVVSTSFVAAGTYSPFIYFRF